MTAENPIDVKVAPNSPESAVIEHAYTARFKDNPTVFILDVEEIDPEDGLWRVWWDSDNDGRLDARTALRERLLTAAAHLHAAAEDLCQLPLPHRAREMTDDLAGRYAEDAEGLEVIAFRKHLGHAREQQ